MYLLSFISIILLSCTVLPKHFQVVHTSIIAVSVFFTVFLLIISLRGVFLIIRRHRIHLHVRRLNKLDVFMLIVPSIHSEDTIGNPVSTHFFGKHYVRRRRKNETEHKCDADGRLESQ